MRTRKPFLRILPLAVPALALGLLLWRAGAQQAGGAAGSPTRAEPEVAVTEAYTTEPGGTPEERLWEVLILMGVGDKQPSSWEGNLSIKYGELHTVEGYRFELPDRILPQGGWQFKTDMTRVLLGSSLAGHDSGRIESRLLPKGVRVRGAGSESTRVSVRLNQGTFSFDPVTMRFGEPTRHLGGRVEVRRVPPATDLSGTPLRQHDFPSIAAAGDGTIWVTWVSWHGGQEELNLRRYKDGQWTRLIPVGRARADLWRPHVTTDEKDRPWLIWSQQTAGNWDIYAMPWLDNEWGKLHRITTNPLPDIEPHVARGSDGTVYVVWQALVGRTSRIHLAYLKAGAWSKPIEVTSSRFSDWDPAVAVGPDGQVWIAWDRYTTSYDIYCRSYSPAAGFSPEMPVASSGRFEAYASIAVDSRNRPWIAWETGAANWGKDLGAALGNKAPGAPLGGTRRIEVAVLDGQTWKMPAQPAFQDTLALGATESSSPLLSFDPDGNLWMAFKRRYSRQAFRPSTYWETYLTRLEGDRWSDPIPLPNSWTRKSVRLGLAAAGGRLWAFWPSESRNYAFASRPLANRVIAGSVVLPGKTTAEPRLEDYRPEPDQAPALPPDEAKHVAAIRAHRVTLGSETLRIVRGDLHRHTELSQDQGGLDDGSLPEFYRYMIDAADMDFGASTDHQAGGTDYWNSITLKMADMFKFPQRFTSFYAYERNLANPHGHRNIIHTQRNYPIVPFFQRIDRRFMLPDSPDGELLTFNSASFGGAIENDTKLLYEELRKSGGLAISHTSATSGMGTDWRDNDPKLEPVVEIYQGARQNYEHKNAPRGIRDGEEKRAIGGFQEPGLVWNAWKKGYRLGVIASSDHFSTHISYAMVYTPAAGRRAIFDAIRKRHTYGATDNVILEFWMGDHFMGDDFAADTNQKIRIKVRGTAPIQAIHLIRDAKFIYKAAPGKPLADVEYTDKDAGKGAHWYYVRVEQADGELAWSSPIWVRY